MTHRALGDYILDNLGGFVTLTVLIGAGIASNFVSERKINDENKVNVLISSKDYGRIFRKAFIVSHALLFTCVAVFHFYGKKLANISPYLFALLVPITFLSVIPVIYYWRRSYYDYDLIRIDMPRPFFRVLGLFLLLITIIVTYLGGIEIAKDLLAGRK